MTFTATEGPIDDILFVINAEEQMYVTGGPEVENNPPGIMDEGGPENNPPG